LSDGVEHIYRIELEIWGTERPASNLDIYL